MTTSNLAPSIEQQVRDSLESGARLILDYRSLIEVAKDPDKPEATVEVKADLCLDTLYQLAGVLQGAGLLQLIPLNLLPAGAAQPREDCLVRLATVVITLDTREKRVSGLRCRLELGKDGAGLPWTISRLGAKDFTVTLLSLEVALDPGQPDESLEAAAGGSVAVAALFLDVGVTYPEALVRVSQPKDAALDLVAFLGDLGLSPVAFRKSLYLHDLDFTGRYKERSAKAQARLATADERALTLLPNPDGGADVLALRDMSLALAHAPGATEAAINGQLLCLEKLAFVAQAHLDTGSGAWSLDGEIDVPATWRLLHGGGDPPEEPAVTLADLAGVFAPDAKVPDVLSRFGIAELVAHYAYVDEDSRHWCFKGVFGGEWAVAGGIRSKLQIHLTDRKKTVSADFDMEGFGFALGYEIGAEEKITAAIRATVGGRRLAIDGDYQVGKKILTLRFTSDVDLALLLGWFVREATRNRHFALPEPWNGIFKGISLPKAQAKKLSFTLNAVEKSVACRYELETSIDFFGFSLKGFEITYKSQDRDKSKGRSGLHISLDGKFPGIEPAWDPGSEQPPAVPGHQAALLEIRLAAAGQHIGFRQPPPETVEKAVGELAEALDPKSWGDGLYPVSLRFSRDIGWLLGGHLKILDQVDLQLIFSDPAIYGVLLEVEASKGDTPTKLDALAGLRAEILYRKVNETIGEYRGTLTLPDSIARIDYNALQITLPSVALSIYTNGAFMIDVGFPHKRDFSRSFSVTGGLYSGAGGFYYAKLDGLDPSTLPAVPEDYGVFNPVTELGIGLRIGVVRRFSSGPLSAELSIVLQAIFEGTFATFTRYADNRQDEYYAVRASVAVIGRLSGRVNLEIIQATVEVTLYVEVGLNLIAHRKATAEVSVGVSVKVSLKINCGFFTIHIQVSFETTIRQQIAFGEDTPALWDTPRLAARAALAMAAAPPRIGWQPIADDAPLVVYFIPQLTAGLAYPVPEDARHWYYVGQLALSNPLGDAADFANAKAPSYANLVRGVLRWGLTAIGNEGGATPVPRAEAEAKSVSRAEIEGLLEALSDGTRPGLDDVRGLFAKGFRTSIAGPPTDGGADLSVGFFPILPGMEVRIQAAGKDARPLAPSDGEGQAIQSGLLVDYLVLALRAALQKVLDLTELFGADDDRKPIGEILAALEDAALGSISGMTTRFMLHGTRIRAGEGAAHPLYALTGQQARLEAADLAAAQLSMTLAWDEDSLGAWAATFENGGTSLTLSSGDGEPVVFKPAEIPAAPAMDLSGVAGEALPAADIRPLRFHLRSGIDGPDAVSLWRLPPSLLDQLSDPESASLDFDIYRLEPKERAGKQVASERYAWALSVDFRVRRIPEPNGAGGTAFLENTYELAGVDRAGLLRLQRLIKELEAGEAHVAKLELAHLSAKKTDHRSASDQAVEGHELVLAALKFPGTFLVRSNLSTETRPPERLRALAVGRVVDPRDTDFIHKLWTGGITNSGGYYLFHAGPEGAGLPPGLFANDTATLTLIVHLSVSSPGPLPSTVNCVRTEGFPVQDDSQHLYVAAAGLRAAHPILRPGEVGLRVTRPVPAEPTEGEAYDRSLGQLYNLIAGRIAKIGDQALPVSGMAALIGPLDQEGDEDVAPTFWNYRHVFTTLPEPEGEPVSPPPETRNPYRYIGETVGFELLWTDLYGNQWGALDPPDVTPGYFDPLVSLHQLPYLSIDYGFKARGGEPLLVISFGCRLPDDAERDRLEEDLAAYAAAYYQLSPTAKGYGVEATVETSLVVGAGLAVATETIRRNVAAIHAGLARLYRGEAAAAQSVELKPLEVAVPTGDAAFNQALYFPLTVSLVLRRDGPVDPSAELPEAKAPGPVRRLGMAIAPRTAGKPKSLAPFARDFRAAFSAHDLRLAVGAAWRDGGTARSEQVWAVRYGPKGIGISFTGEPGYYAPRPLSNTLLSRRVAVRRLDEDGALSDQTDELSVADIDLDAEMKRFLAAVDRIFAPESAVPATLVNPEAVSRLSRSKKALVERLVDFVTSLKETDVASHRHAAAERYRQACLIRLEAFYDMASVAVTPVETIFSVPPSEGRLNVFGHPIRKNGKRAAPDGDEEFSLTHGKCALAAGDPVPMAIGLFAKHKSRFGSYRADLEFTLDALEHDIETVTLDDTAYAVGSWLRFVDPQDPLPIGEVEIPIPLRAFPEPPQLTGQFAAPSIDDTDLAPSEDPNLLLERAKSWALNGRYRQDYAAQDKVHLDVRLNIGLDKPMLHARAARRKDLLDTLVEFNRLHPELQAVFDTQDLRRIQTPEMAEGAEELRNALDSFAELVASVADCDWTLGGAARRMAARLGDPGLVERRSRFAIEDGIGVMTGSDEWKTTVTFEADIEAPVGVLPLFRIDGYDTRVDEQTTDGRETATFRFESRSAPGSYLKAADAWRIPSRTAAIPALNIVDRQNGLLSMMIRRNEDLPAAFHYETPWVTYTEKTAPLLGTALPIRMAGLGAPQGAPARRTLEGHLAAFFAALLAGSGTGDTPLGSFQAVAAFDYPLSATLALSPISLPVTLRLPSEVTFGEAPAETPDYVVEMARFIAAWLDDHELTPAREALWAASRLRFDVSLFARVSETGQPILRLPNVLLPCAYIELK